MGFLERFRGKKEEAAPKENAEPEVPKTGTVSMLWGPADRRQAGQEELKALQESMSADADAKIAKYAPVLDNTHDADFGDLSAKEAGLLRIMMDNYVAIGGMPSMIGNMLDMDRKEWNPAVEKLLSKGYICHGTIEDRIAAMDPEELREALAEKGAEVCDTDGYGFVKSVLGSIDEATLLEVVSGIPELYAVTDKGDTYLSSRPVLSEFYTGDDFGITIGQACVLKSVGDGDLFTLCQKMYMELIEAYWSKKDFKHYLDYCEKLAYLDMHRYPEESAYALAHLINANSVYKSSRILWEVPLKTVYANSELSVEDIARYAAEEFAFGIYPKMTKVDKFPEVFAKFLKDTEKKV